MRLRRIASFILCVAGFSLGLGGLRARGQELDAPARATLLEQLREVHAKDPGFQAAFTEERSSHLLNKPVTSQGVVYFSVPDKLRLEVHAPSPSTTVSDGHTMWIFYPAFNEVEMYSLGERSVFDVAALTAGLNFEHIDEYYNFRAYHEAGGYRLVLAPKKPSLRRMVEELTLWLNGDFLPERTEITLPKGDHLTYVYHDPRRPVLAASLFEFSPPPGAHITRPMGR